MFSSQVRAISSTYPFLTVCSNHSVDIEKGAMNAMQRFLLYIFVKEGFKNACAFHSRLKSDEPLRHVKPTLTLSTDSSGDIVVSQLALLVASDHSSLNTETKYMFRLLAVD
jgi:hypothetical protein